jgi:hypothetical protein
MCTNNKITRRSLPGSLSCLVMVVGSKVVCLWACITGTHGLDRVRT